VDEREGREMKLPRKELWRLYNQLLMAVASKYPNETRHETALKYIKEAEQSRSEGTEVKEAV
jgi:hypothetical protein